MKVVPSERGPQIGPKRVLRLRSDATAGGDPGSDGGPPSGLLDSLGLTEAAALAGILAACPIHSLPEGSSGPFSWLPDVVLIVVERGLILIRSAESASQRPIVTGEGGPGAILVPPGPGEVLQALTEARVTAISAQVRDRLIAIPGAARVLVEGLTGAVRDTRELSRTFGGVRQVDRVRDRLLQLGRNHGRVGRDGIRLDFPITHELLAEMLGIWRETVTRAFDELEQEGFVVRDGRSYRLLMAPEDLRG